LAKVPYSRNRRLENAGERGVHIVQLAHSEENSMQKITTFLRSLANDESGATMVEYGLMVALIAIICVVAVASIGTELDKQFDKIVACLKAPGTAAECQAA
jgi:pilus assembly protein Flp/PilA